MPVTHGFGRRLQTLASSKNPIGRLPSLLVRPSWLNSDISDSLSICCALLAVSAAFELLGLVLAVELVELVELVLDVELPSEVVLSDELLDSEGGGGGGIMLEPSEPCEKIWLVSIPLAWSVLVTAL